MKSALERREISEIASRIQRGDQRIFDEFDMDKCSNLFGIAARWNGKIAKQWFHRFPCKWENTLLISRGLTYVLKDMWIPNTEFEFTLDTLLIDDSLCKNYQRIFCYIYDCLMESLCLCIPVKGLAHEVVSFIHYPLPRYTDDLPFRKWVIDGDRSDYGTRRERAKDSSKKRRLSVV
jgi:hypothetical protein